MGDLDEFISNEDQSYRLRPWRLQSRRSAIMFNTSNSGHPAHATWGRPLRAAIWYR